MDDRTFKKFTSNKIRILEILKIRTFEHVKYSTNFFYKIRKIFKGFFTVNMFTIGLKLGVGPHMTSGKVYALWMLKNLCPKVFDFW